MRKQGFICLGGHLYKEILPRGHFENVFQNFWKNLGIKASNLPSLCLQKSGILL